MKRNQLVVLAIALAIGGGIYFYWRDKKGKQQAADLAIKSESDQRQIMIDYVLKDIDTQIQENEKTPFVIPTIPGATETQGVLLTRSGVDYRRLKNTILSMPVNEIRVLYDGALLKSGLYVGTKSNKQIQQDIMTVYSKYKLTFESQMAFNGKRNKF